MNLIRAKQEEKLENNHDLLLLVIFKIIFFDNLFVFVVPDPCDQHVCGWGKECVVDKKGRPVCECK